MSLPVCICVLPWNVVVYPYVKRRKVPGWRMKQRSLGVGPLSASSVPGVQVWTCLQVCPHVLPTNCAWDGPVKNPRTWMEDGPLDVTFGCTCTREVFIPLYRSLYTPSSLNLKTKSQWLPSAASKLVLIILLILSNNALFYKQLHSFGRAIYAVCHIKVVHKCSYSPTVEQVTNLHGKWFPLSQWADQWFG